jgi:Fe-coproporphyrin III synthase
VAYILGINSFKRYLTLKTHKIHAMPVAILMPHSSCNCRCVMCDIWRGNANLQQLTEADLKDLLVSFKQLDTRWVVMSGGEALMNPGLFRLCAILRQGGIQKITILSTGLLLKKYAQQVAAEVDEVIVSLDGPEEVHNAIRRIPQAYQKLREGVQAVKALKPDFPISGRCVIQRLNFAHWPAIVDAAHDIGLDQISFLAADVSSEAFNRPQLWDEERVEEVNLRPEQLPEMHTILEGMIQDYAADFASHYIAESPDKLRRIYAYYAALHGQGNFPAVRCNAPWVSTVVESDGTVRPCYFHEAIGNVRQTPLTELLNSPSAVAFRQQLDMDTDPICRKCVCSLNLRPTIKVG